MRNGERTREDCTRLAILALAVAEKERVRSRVVVPQLARLTHKAAAERCSAIHLRTRRENEIITHHTSSNLHSSLSATVD